MKRSEILAEKEMTEAEVEVGVAGEGEELILGGGEEVVEGQGI